MSRFLVFFLLLGFAGPLAHAQRIAVSIRITDGASRPLPHVALKLEGILPKEKPTALTDSAGTATVQLEAGVMYLAEISHEGYGILNTNISADSLHRSFSFSISKTNVLSGATVTARKPLMRQEDDKTIVDPEALVDASTSSYEVLEKVPGVIADQDGNFYMTSTTPATIYINGREMKMSNADIASMLKSLPPNSIEKIEILRTPSAKYDASGGGGILNIVLKKGVKVGLTGSVNAAMQQGVYGNQNIGLNLSYNDGDQSAYVNVNVAHRKSVEHINTQRVLSYDSLLGQEARTIYDSRSVYLGYGAGKMLGKKWDVSFDGRMTPTVGNNNSTNNSVIRAESGNPWSDNLSTNANKSSGLSHEQSVNAKYKIDTNGSEWVTQAAWSGNYGNSTQALGSTFTLPAQPGFTSNGDISSNRNYLMLQSDLTWKYRYRLTFEAGFKTGYNAFRHNSDFTATYNGTTYEDPYRSITYRYRENINSVYFQVSKRLLKDIIIKPGLRLENTNMIGQQQRPGNAEFSIRRTDLFPYIYLSKKVMEIAGLELRAYLVYRKTINRPGYDQLNPYQRFLDQYLYETGNPNLRPQFTHNYEANVMVDEHPIIAIGLNDVKDIFSNVIYQDAANPSLAYRTYDNLGKNREFYIRGMAAVPPGGTYFGVIGAQYNLNMYDGYYNGEPLKYNRESWLFYTYHSLKLGKLSTFSLHGFMRLKGLLQFTEVESFGALNASINRSFYKKKLVATFSAQDIFFTNRNQYTLNQGPISLSGERYSDSRRMTLSLRYNFGVKLKEEKKEFMGGETGAPN